MACLNLSNGFFQPISWSTAPSITAGATTVSRTPTQIAVTRTGQTGSAVSSGDHLYAVFGDGNFVATLKRDPGAGQITWSVAMIDTTTPAISGNLLFSVTLPSSHSPPQIAQSPGNGRLVFFFSGTGMPNEVRSMMIMRSDGSSPSTPVLAGPGTISGVNSSIDAQVTDSELIIHFPNSGAFDREAKPRPSGTLKMVAPNPHDFGEAVLGGPAALATRTSTVTLRNDGDDCLKINAIGNQGAYTVTGISPAFGTDLAPGATATVTIVFAPTAPGTNITASLPVTRDPAKGDAAIACKGRARNAEARIALNRAQIDFGTIPFPGTRTESFVITNNGDLDLNVAVPPLSGASAFTWSPTGNAPLAIGATRPVSVTFTAPGDFAAPDETITITPSQGTARQITFRGAGCVPNAVPVLPPGAPIPFGEVERGFRTVRFRTVRNNGDGDLQFEARILPAADPAHAALFGLILPGGDITDAPTARSYTLPPVSRCGAGPTGTGEMPVAVGFHANAAPQADPFSATLELRVLPAGPVATYPLSASITPAAPIDAVLVLDRSGSMNDPAGPPGSRTKIDAALAAGQLFAQMLRADADDRVAVVSFNDSPAVAFAMAPVAGNAATVAGALNFTAGGATNIAGGVILALAEIDNNPRAPEPAGLKRTIVALTDGKENRCFQVGGAGDWFSITGRDAPEMRRPDNSAQDSEVLPAPTHVKVHAIALGGPAHIDGPALDALSSATGARFGQVQDLTGADFFLLEKHFTQIFMDVAGLSVIADPFYSIALGEKHVHEFDVFPGDVSAMVVIYDVPDQRLPFFLVTPGGETISPLSLPAGFGLRFRSTPTARFVEIGFPAGEPDRYATTIDRRWQAIVAHDGEVCHGDINPSEQGLSAGLAAPPNAVEVGPGFQPIRCKPVRTPVPYGIAIAAGSNLRLQAFVEPGAKLVGQPIRLNAVLAEAGLPLTGAALAVQILHPDGSSSTLTLRDDGANADGAPDDGDYGGQFVQTSQAGVYQFTFRAEGLHAGRPFVREAHRTKAVGDRRDPRQDPSGGGGDRCCREVAGLLNHIRKALWLLLVLTVLALILLFWLAR